MAGWRVMRHLFLMMVVLLSGGVVGAQKPEGVRAPDETILLWGGEARGGKPPGGWAVEGAEVREEQAHMGGIVTLRNVGEPALYVYGPQGVPQNRAVIICPGGAYHLLAWDLEGTEVASWLSGLGYHAFVLKYRLPRGGDKERHGAALEDAQRAVSLVRGQAVERGIAPDRVGIMGFSAGGHLAALTGDRGNERSYKAEDAVDAVPCRPDFTVLVYPAYLIPDQNAAEGAGVKEPVGGATGLSPLFRGLDQAPPSFMVHAVDDPVPVGNSTAYLLALKSRKVPGELHVYPDGGHGYGLRSGLTVKGWPQRLAEWLGRVPAGVVPVEKKAEAKTVEEKKEEEEKEEGKKAEADQ
jgi:acetyl esterase/lipase